MKFTSILLLIFLQASLISQNFDFNFNSTGRRVCLVSSTSNNLLGEIRLLFLDSISNSNKPINVYRRLAGTANWNLVAEALPPGTGHWIDSQAVIGEVWEYQVKRLNTWDYQSMSYDATGYTMSSLLSYNYDYKGRMILLVSEDIPSSLSEKYFRLKKEITADGWFIDELVVPRASNWDSGVEVVNIKNQLTLMFSNAPEDDKPKLLFILGHVPLPRSGSTDVVAPDDHSQNKGARGCDAYYADIDGVFTDTATFNPGNLSTPLAINLPGDFKWDQDFFPSDIEMAFGRVDFADLIDLTVPEMQLLENYFDRLSNYRNVNDGFAMGEKSAFYLGYDNSNDGSYRTLPNISQAANVYQNHVGENHAQWVSENGPFKIYMQNQLVPSIADWQNFGMNATVYSSDQSYWGFGDVPQGSGSGVYSRIRALLGVDTKCLITLWTTTGINIFHNACQGMALGLAMKNIMNHNAQNQYLEKSPQSFDDQNWWNRTHFAFYGDPSLNLYQVVPPANVSIIDKNGHAELNWERSPDTTIGYHIFESDAELGKFERISTTLNSDTTFSIPNYQIGNWYMVKAVKSFTSGCGNFVHMSIGKEVLANLALHLPQTIKQTTFSLAPNPARSEIRLASENQIYTIEIFSIDGRLVFSQSNINNNSVSIDLSGLENGSYLLKCEYINHTVETQKFIIQK